MSQFRTSILPASHRRWYLTFFVLIICIVSHDASANDAPHPTSAVEKSSPNDVQLSRRGVWSRLFRHENNPTRTSSRAHYLPTASDYTFPAGPIQIFPLDKRTIPIELQKALYAHGIVGRRR